MTNLIIACLLSGVASLFLGFIWYHKKVFGTAWMKETGMTEEKAQSGNMAMIFGLTFIVSVYMAYEMKWINHDDPLPAILHGMYHGAKHVGVFAFGAILVNALYEQRSFKFILINGGFWIVVFAVIGAIMTAFPSFNPTEEDATEGEDTEMHIEYNSTDLISEMNAVKEDTYLGLI